MTKHSLAKQNAMFFSFLPERDVFLGDATCRLSFLKKTIDLGWITAYATPGQMWAF
jgi:hypothetical protein